MYTLPSDTPIAGAGEVSIIAAPDLLSAKILRAGKVYAVVNSAEEAWRVLRHGAAEYHLFIGPTDSISTNIAKMVRALKKMFTEAHATALLQAYRTGDFRLIAAAEVAYMDHALAAYGDINSLLHAEPPGYAQRFAEVMDEMADIEAAAKVAA